jgi:hypothetical protein
LISIAVRTSTPGLFPLAFFATGVTVGMTGVSELPRPELWLLAMLKYWVPVCRTGITSFRLFGLFFACGARGACGVSGGTLAGLVVVMALEVFSTGTLSDVRDLDRGGVFGSDADLSWGVGVADLGLGVGGFARSAMVTGVSEAGLGAGAGATLGSSLLRLRPRSDFAGTRGGALYVVFCASVGFGCGM